mgnify:FL=1
MNNSPSNLEIVRLKGGAFIQLTRESCWSNDWQRNSAPVDWDAVRRVIENDCKARRSLRDSKGRTCAVGALALHFGLPLQYAYKGVAYYLRVSLAQVEDIWQANDHATTITARRKAVLGVVNQLADAQARS